MIEVIFNEKRESEMNEAARWFFWKNKSVVVLTSLYSYSQRSRKKRLSVKTKRTKIKQMSFAAIKRKWYIKQTLRNLF